MLKKVVAHPDVKNDLVNLMKETFQDPDAKDAITTLLNESFNKILLDPETIEKFRIFTYNLMKAEIQGQGNSKSSLFDLMVKKAVSRKNSANEEKSELEDLLRNVPEIEEISPEIVENEVEKLDSSVITTDSVKEGLDNLASENVPELDLESALQSKIDQETQNFEQIDAQNLESSSIINSNNDNDFVIIGGEISPS
jgi:hypothetical protein